MPATPLQVRLALSGVSAVLLQPTCGAADPPSCVAWTLVQQPGWNHTFALEMVPLLLLQMMEDLEQLKILENGYRMKVGGSCPHLRVWPQGSGCRFS